MGATSIWERWDTIKPDSTFSNPVMNSFDIPQLGSIGDWLYREVAGIDTYEDGPGYKHIRIKPYIANGLTSAQGTLQTYYGEVSSHWEMESRELIFYVTIPVNTKATVYVPGEDVSSVFENGEKVSTEKEIQLAGTEDGYVVLNLGSGSYHFTVTR
jgi:alpha-L-rhamnosidase